MLLSFLFLSSLVKGDTYDPSNTPSPVQANCDDLKNHASADKAINSISSYDYNGCQGSERNHVFIDASTIGEYAFLRCQIISQVSFCKGVSTISKGAFARCSNLLSISFLDRTGSSTLSINNGAFYLCSGINTPVSIPTFVSSIDLESFAYTGRFTLNIADRSSTSVSTLQLGNRAFYNSNLVVATIPHKVSVGDDTFSWCTNIESINYQGGDIGDNAFEYCSKLKTFTFATDSTISSIGDYVFRSTILEGKLALPDSLKTIGDFAFYGTSISGDLNLNEVVSVGESAFQGCSGLGTLTATNVVSFGDKAFKDTEVTGNLVLNKEVVYIGEYSFYKTKITGLKIQNTDNSADPSPNIGEFAFAYCSTPFESIDISDQITISRYAFAGLTITKDVTIETTIYQSAINVKAFIDATIGQKVSLTRVQIAKDAFLNAKMDSLSIISRSTTGDDVSGFAFANCQILTKIDLTDVRLGDDAFRGLSKSSSPNVTFYHNDDYSYCKTSIGDNAFYETTITGVNSLLENVSYLGSFAFYHCKNLDGDLTLNVSTIGNYAFTYCSYTDLLIGSLVGTLDTKIGDDDITNYYGFQGCPLKSLVFEQSYDENKIKVTIPPRSFYKMKDIKNDLFIPAYIQTIGSEAFSGCSSISGLEFEQYPSSITLGQNAFYGCSAIPKLNLTRDVSSIPDYAFYKCTSLNAAIFPETLTSIGKYAFSQTKLSGVSFPDSLLTIDYGAFQDCTSMEGNLDIPDLVTKIETRAFCGCPFKNSKLTVGKSLSTIGDYAFYQCGFNDHLNLPDVISIGAYAFYGCSGFSGPLVLHTESSENTGETNEPYSALTIGLNAFQGCSGLTGQIPTNYLTQLTERSFADCKGFSGILNLSKFTVIPPYAFYNCENLNTLILPDTVTAIGKYAFYGCTNLEGPLELPSIKTIGKYAFAKCSKLSGPLKFPISLSHIDDYAFSECSGFSDSLSFDVNTLTIGEGAFKGCSGFKKGTLSFTMKSSSYEEAGNTGNRHFSYPYFLRIQNYAFEDAKFDDVYYLGRFEPDCDYESGIKEMKKVHTASNYVNSSFCRKTVRKNGLSGGAIAGIVIAVIVVVAVIVVLVILLIREKKKRDHSEGEVEMNES